MDHLLPHFTKTKQKSSYKILKSQGLATFDKCHVKSQYISKSLRKKNTIPEESFVYLKHFR